MRTANFRRDDGKFGTGEADKPQAKDPVKVTEKQRDTRFKKGQPRPPNAGRKKGTPNKWSQVAAEIMERRDINPIEWLCDLVEDPETHPDRKLRALIELCQYAYPKKRELSGDLDIHMVEATAEALRRGRERVANAAQAITEKPQTSTAPASPKPDTGQEIDLSTLSDEELQHMLEEARRDEQTKT